MASTLATTGGVTQSRVPAAATPARGDARTAALAVGRQLNARPAPLPRRRPLHGRTAYRADGTSGSTWRISPSVPVTRTGVPAGSSGPCTVQNASPILTRPRPATIG